MHSIYSTQGLGGLAKRQYWQESLHAVCGEFDTHVDGWENFFGQIDVRSIAGFEVAGHFMNATKVTRSRYQVAHSREDYYFLLVQLSGRCRLSQKGHEAVLQPGDMTVIDSAQPSEFDYDGPFRQYSVHLPRHVLKARLGPQDIACSRRIDGARGMGALTGNLIRSLYAEAGELTPKQGAVVREALLDMILSTTMLEGNSLLPANAASARSVQLYHLQQFIEARLADPDLTPSVIADAYGLSTRHLHRVFEGAGESVGDWMRRRRLERARDDLINPGFAGQSVIQIAFKAGFNDASHFSRIFKAAFGMSPRQYRQESPGGRA
jgi:AraC-like DNA-binding protein